MKAFEYVGLDQKIYLVVCEEYKIDSEEKIVYWLKNGLKFKVRFLFLVMATENYNDDQKIVFEEFKGVLI